MGITPYAGLAALVIAAPLLIQNPAPRDTPPPPPPPPAGTSSISGQVVAADNGAAVKRATVNISGRSSATGRGVAGAGGRGSVVMGVVGMGGRGGVYPPQITDEAGRFEFPNIPGGMYSITVSPRNGYVRPPRPQMVEVEEGKTATVAVKLERTGVITGRVLDESGDPLVRARVTALRREPNAGGRLMSTGTGATTDDLGQFRLFDLPPGQYFVSGSDSNQFSFSSVGPMGAAPALGYAPTYFPGSASVGGARVITVKSAQETPGIDFSLVRVVMGRIIGTVRDSAGQVATARANVSLAPGTEDVAGFSRGSSVRPDGTFMIGEIPPGEYYVIASVSSGEGPNAPREGAYLPVTVNGGDVTVDMRTNAGATVRGQVLIEGTPPPISPAVAALGGGGAPQVTVQARPSSPGGSLSMMVMSQRPATASEDGTFELTGLRGPVLLTASGPRMALKSVTRGSQDLTVSPLEFKGTERIGSVTVTMTYDVGAIDGTVTNDQGEPVPGGMVVVFPDDDSRWFIGSPFIHVYGSMVEMPASARPSATSAIPGMLPAGRRERVPGSFVSSGLLPGKYLVLGFEAGNRPPTDRETLAKLREQAATATVMAGSTASVQVRVVK